MLAGTMARCAEWRIRFFHDADDSTLAITDLKFPSPRRGVASALLTEGRKLKPVVLLTSDGGANWTTLPVKEAGLSLFFLDDSTGWMVTRGGIWHTLEGGRSWTKLSGLRGAVRVHFRDRMRGWAVGSPKAAWQTGDGGKTWTALAAAAEPPAAAAHSIYNAIEFANDNLGMIVGSNRPPRPDESPLPDWMDPEKARLRRERPTLTLLLDTRDGGQTWKASTSSLFGQVTRLSLGRDLRGLALIEFQYAMEVPSEVFAMDLRTGQSKRVFRDKERAVTDVLLFEGGPAFLAAVEPPGLLRHLPVPGKLKILQSEDLSRWVEIPVDYRAFARRIVLAAAGKDAVWAATDTGVILKLESAASKQ